MENCFIVSEVHQFTYILARSVIKTGEL